jgi:hypothetical protein
MASLESRCLRVLVVSSLGLALLPANLTFMNSILLDEKTFPLSYLTFCSHSTNLLIGLLYYTLYNKAQSSTPVSSQVKEYLMSFYIRPYVFIYLFNFAPNILPSIFNIKICLSSFETVIELILESVNP